MDVSVSFMLQPLYPQAIILGTPCLWGWVYPRVGLDVMENGNISCLLLRVQLCFLGRPPLSQFDVHVAVHRCKFLTMKSTRCTNFSNFLGIETLHVSDSSSVHLRDFSSVHTAVVYVIQVCWQLASRIRMEHTPLLCVQLKTSVDGQRDCPKHVEFHSKIKAFEKLVHIVGIFYKKYRMSSLD
jgi:hypothetical protein